MQFLTGKLTVFPKLFLKTTNWQTFTDTTQFSQTFKALKSLSHFPQTIKDLQRPCNIWCTTCGLLWPLSASISKSAQVFIFCFQEIFPSIVHILKTQLVSMYHPSTLFFTLFVLFSCTPFGTKSYISGYDNNFFSHLPCRASRYFSTCPSGKTSCQILKINHFD